MAKADLRKAELEDWRGYIGQAIERMRMLSGLSLKEFAARLDRDERQIARWIAGTERPQFDVLFADEGLRQALVIALCELAGGGVEITTQITVRRVCA
jgi:transcriptional regulator with XRE-family HTH domain